jgi:AAA domain
MITERELRAKAYELSAGVCRPAQADRLVNELARSGELVRLQDRTWTTRRLREMEQSTVDIAKRRTSENTAPVGEQSLKQARREIGREIKGSLTQEQREALETITGQGGVSVLVGRAGTGKGVTISAAARAWQLEDKEVIGTAIAGATAKRLQADAKLNRSMTTDSLLNQVEKGHIRLDKETVVVMDETGMADSDRLSRLVKMTGERESKLVLAGDSAQLGSIGAGGLFKEIEGTVPTAELTEVHRARHEWERKAWEHIRAGEPGPALAQYQAHDRLHIHDTRAEAAEAMVENWDQTRRSMSDRQAVMITDASNKERDQMNAMAQERRAQAGELGAHRVELPEKPYGLASGDEIIFTAQYRMPGEKRVENGITGTILDTSRREGEDRVTIKTNEREQREVDVDTSKFADLSLAYAVHVHKGQGLTAETSGILVGGWQTDREHTYVAVSRAREQTQIYVSREDLGEQGMDTGTIERLAERMKRSRAQEASITKNVAERAPERQQTAERPPQRHHATERTRPREHETDDFLETERRRPLDRRDDDDFISHDQPDHNDHDHTQSVAADAAPQARGPAPIDIRTASPADVQITVVDAGDVQLAYTQQPYDLQSYTGEPTYALFGGWQTETEQGFVAVTQGPHGTDVQISREDRGTATSRPSCGSGSNKASKAPTREKPAPRNPTASASTTRRPNSNPASRTSSTSTMPAATPTSSKPSRPSAIASKRSSEASTTTATTTSASGSSRPWSF